MTDNVSALDINVNQAAKKIISNKFNTWFADKVSKQLSSWIVSGDIKVSLS